MNRSRSYIAIIVAALSVTAFAAAAPAAPAEGAPAKAAPAGEVIPLYVSGQHALMIVRIGDSAPAPVIFDTGTTDDVLDTGFAKSLRLERTGASHVIDGATGQGVPGYSAALPRVAMHRVVRTGVEVQVTDFPHPDAVGVFGPNTFAGGLVALDFAKSRTRILEKSALTIPSAPAEPYLGPADDALPAAHVTIAGQVIQAYLDSGASAAITLPLAMADQLPLQAKPVKTGSVRSASGEQDVFSARLQGDVKLGPLTLHDPAIDFVAKAAQPNIGLPVLKRLEILLDPAERRSWIIALSE
jgi:predicted aspartyl protease